MFSLSRTKLGLWVYMTTLLLGTNLSLAQPNKEDRNYHPQSKPLKKNEWKVKKAPVAYSPHLSYREQKQMNLAQKKVGGLTVYVNGKKEVSANYKQPQTKSKSSKASKEVAKTATPDTSAAYRRYELDTLKD